MRPERRADHWADAPCALVPLAALRRVACTLPAWAAQALPTVWQHLPRGERGEQLLPPAPRLGTHAFSGAWHEHAAHDGRLVRGRRSHHDAGPARRVSCGRDGLLHTDTKRSRYACRRGRWLTPAQRHRAAFRGAPSGGGLAHAADEAPPKRTAQYGARARAADGGARVCKRCDRLSRE